MKRSVLFGLLAGIAGIFAGTATRAACVVDTLAELPITMAGTRPMVVAKINGHEVSMVADSGAFFSTLSPSIASELKLPIYPLPFGYRVGGVGGSAIADLTRVTFSLGKTDIPKVEFIVAAGSGGDGSAGLMGQNVLGMGDAEYDLANGIIRLFRPKGCGDRPLIYWAGDKPFSAVDISYEDINSKKVTGTAYVNGKRVRVLFDTGSWASVMTLRAAERAGVTTSTPGVVTAGYSHGIGSRALRTYIGHFDSFKIGDEEIKNTSLRFSEFDLADADMLLGADFFLSHRVFVANSQRKVYFTYNGGPVFNLSVQPSVAAATGSPANLPSADGAKAETSAKSGDPAAAMSGEPHEASDFDRRAAAEAGRHDYEHAAADYDKAVALAPNEARYHYQRAQTRLALKQAGPAMSDLDDALRLQPDDLDALTLRAILRRTARDRTGAKADLDHAASIAPKSSDAHLRLAEIYLSMNLFDPALAQYDLWIGSHADEGEMVEAVAGRCRARVLVNRDLDRALGDCNHAIRLGPITSGMYDTRGLVQLRLGHDDDAIADYNRALTVQPKSIWSLYGRGVAKLHKGDKAGGDADITAALQLGPRFGETAKRYGFAAPGAPDPPPPSGPPAPLEPKAASGQPSGR